MTSISGKTNVDWDAFAGALAPVKAIAKETVVKGRSRDFFWYSPILNERLGECYGDLVAQPRTVEEVRHCLATAYAADVPIVVRGGGTGNYGQAVPMDGGLILDMTRMKAVLEIGPDFVRAEAGALMSQINAALAAEGREMCMFPSTQNIATIGGFVAGGSSGIGSIAHGMLRDPGNLISLRALSVEEAPQERLFEGADVMQVHHAWGLNGVITEVTLRTVPLQEWLSGLATFDSYEAAYAAAYALAQRTDIGAKLISTVDARITSYFPRLKDRIRPDKHLLVTMVPAAQRDALAALVTAEGGHLDIAVDEEERAAVDLPHVYDFSYNHTTLQVLKADKTATYQQVGCPAPPDASAVARLRAAQGDDVWNHHEFARLGGEIVSFDLPIIWFRSAAQLAAINETFEAQGFPVYDAHTWLLEGAGLKNVDYRHLAWKKRMDPKGLLNSAKSAVWDSVKHLSPDEIEARGA